MDIVLGRIIIMNLLVIILSLSQLPSWSYNAKKTENILTQQNNENKERGNRGIEGNNTALTIPAFEYDRYNLELTEKSTIQLVISQDSRSVKVKVVDASPAGLSIEKARLLKDGLKIIQTPRKRNKISKRDLFREELSTNEEIFNLTRLNNKQKIISGPGYKVFKVTVKPVLLASYTLEATVDENKPVRTIVYTKPDFRIDSITPQLVNFNSEVTFTITGKGLNSFTNVIFSGVNSNGITIKDFESLNDELLKVKVFISPSVVPGFRDVGISNTLTGSVSILPSGIYIGPANGKDGKDGKDGAPGKDGEIGPQGQEGKVGVDGMGICNNPNDTLMIFVNTTASICWNCGQTPSFFDPVLCNLTLEIPQTSTSAQGRPGEAGTTGASGLNSLIKVTNEPKGQNCKKAGTKIQTGLDSNRNNVLDEAEITTTSYVCNGDKEEDD